MTIKALALFVAIVTGNLLYYFLFRGKSNRATMAWVMDTSFMQGVALALMYFIVIH